MLNSDLEPVKAVMKLRIPGTKANRGKTRNDGETKGPFQRQAQFQGRYRQDNRSKRAYSSSLKASVDRIDTNDTSQVKEIELIPAPNIFHDDEHGL